MTHELLYEYNPWWEGDFFIEDILPRKQLEAKLEDLMPSKSVVFLTGLRRVGKTTLMNLIAKKMERLIQPRWVVCLMWA